MPYRVSGREQQRKTAKLLRLWLGSLLLLSIVMVPGCAGLRGMAFRKNEGAFGARTPCSLSKTPTAVEVVDHLNRNVDKIQGWRANSVKIRAQSVPIPLEGHLVVERDHRLRLEVSSLAGKEVDFGSNDELFWLWMRPRGKQPPAVYYAAHDDMDMARQQLPMPFEPTWLMEALGVTPLSTENVHLEGEPGVATIKLVSHHDMPDGQRVKKVIVVHACHGYVMEHSTYDGRGQPLVRALLQDYRLDLESGAVMPHHVKLDWPQAEMSLAMDLGHVEVNPSAVPPAVWKMPQVPGTPMVNLGDPRLAGTQYATRPGPPANRTFASAAAGTALGKPTTLASSAEELGPAFLAPMSPATPRFAEPSAGLTPPDGFGFEQERVSWEESEFQLPVVDEPPGRASVDLLPAIEPF